MYNSNTYFERTNWSLPFQISTNASDIAIRVVLGLQEENMPYVIYYINNILAPARVNYTVTEKEFLGIIHSINKFRHYITSYQNFMHIDHFAI